MLQSNCGPNPPWVRAWYVGGIDVGDMSVGVCELGAPSSSGPGRLVLIQKIAGSTPAGVTIRESKSPIWAIFGNQLLDYVVVVWDRRFELLTSRTPCVRATGLRQSQMLSIVS